MFSLIDCIDAGGEYCPCSLAERGECIICSQLKGMCFCDCLNWSGTCIYQEYMYNREKAKKERQYIYGKILEKRYVRDDIFVLSIKVTQTLARELDNIGAFVFLKKHDDNPMFSTPISVIDSDPIKGIITVAIKIKGVKSKALAECEKTIMVKGPYLNGVQGQRFIKETNGGRILILIRGIAGAATAMVVRKLSKRNNELDILIDRGRFGQSFLEEYFKRYKVNIEYISFLEKTGEITEETKVKLKGLINDRNYSAVLSAGSDDFHRSVLTYIYELNRDIKFLTVNNASMCCGEGVCGSCSIEGKNKKNIRACKEQYNPAEIFVTNKNLTDNCR